MLGSVLRRTDKCVRPSTEKAAQFTNHTKDSDWETLAQRRTIDAYAHFLERAMGNGLVKLYATSCGYITICVGWSCSEN